MPSCRTIYAWFRARSLTANNESPVSSSQDFRDLLLSRESDNENLQEISLVWHQSEYPVGKFYSILRFNLATLDDINNSVHPKSVLNQILFIFVT